MPAKPRRRSLWLLLLLPILAIAAWAFWPKEAENLLTVEAKRGPFEVTVIATGELQPKNEKEINGPNQLQELEIWQTRINTLVPEGTVVKQGDVVATLDQAQVLEKLNQRQSDLTKADAQFLQARLDTTLELRKLRDEIGALELSLIEKKAILEQSKFEPPATIRLAELDLTKAQKNLVQARVAYKIQKQKAQAKMNEVGVAVTTAQRLVKNYTAVLGQMTVKAPAPGMVVYRKSWNGTRIESGSEINAWDMTVATLPDLSEMMSRTYVNETDIQKVKEGMPVRIQLDALPGRKLQGKVKSVSNIGEQRPGSEAKVFEVKVEVLGTNPDLRPSMTTSNSVISSVVKEAVYLPQEAVHTDAKGRRFVYARDGGRYVRHQVETGAVNENEVVIARGLDKGEAVALSIPEGGEKLDFIALEGKTSPTPTKAQAKL